MVVKGLVRDVSYLNKGPLYSHAINSAVTTENQSDVSQLLG